MLKQQIEQDIKTALLGGDKLTALTLRGLKSAILYAEVAQGKRNEGLDDQGISEVLAKEAKKRQESADLYIQGGDKNRADTELQEKRIIEKYLPQQLSESEINNLIEECIAKDPPSGIKDMGRVISAVKAKTGASAEGSLIAKLVKERIEKS